MFDVNISDIAGTVKEVCSALFKVTEEKFIRLCRKGDLKAVKKALENGANVNAWEEKGRTVLIEAAKKGNLELVQLLIRFNADVNAKDDKGITALMEASRHGYLFTAEALIRAGADVNATTHSGWTALMQAVKFGHPQTAAALLDNGAKFGMKTKHGKKAIDFLPKDKNIFAGTKALKILTSTSKPKKPDNSQNSGKPSFITKVLSIFRR